MSDSSIPEGLIGDLSDLGRQGGTADAAREQRLKQSSAINRLHWSAWNKACENLPDDDLALLAKGLVIAEERFRWSGGSVAGAIWVYRIYERRQRENAHLLAEWMLRESTNPWVPFGSNRGDARSLAEYHKLQDARAKRRSDAAQATLHREEAAKQRRAARLEAGEQRQHESREGSAERSRHLEALQSLPLKERLMVIASDAAHPLHYYEPSLITPLPEVLGRDGGAALEVILQKASTLKRGPWRRWLKSVSLKTNSGSVTNHAPH